jgi:HAD superfamily hydrolase (TIGR01509 family)
LDVDGTLVDSNEMHVRAWVDAFEQNGIQVSPEQIRPLIGMGGDKIIPRIARVGEDSKLGKKIGEARSQAFCERQLPCVRAFPHVRDLLERMRADGMKLVVASSAKEEELAPLLRIAGVRDLIADETSSDDAERSKPDPDIVRAALDECGAAPNEVVMLGDTPYDIEAAARAGIGVIAFRCGGRRDADLAGAIAIYDDAADLLARYDSSPLCGGDGGQRNGARSRQ